jgi:hypothetical protein
MADRNDRNSDVRLQDLIDTLFEKLDELKDGHAQIREGIAEIRRDVGATTDKARLVHEIVLGNGTPERGLASRLKTLEDTEGRRSWFVGTAVVAGVGALVTMLADWLKG